MCRTPVAGYMSIHVCLITHIMLLFRRIELDRYTMGKPTWCGSERMSTLIWRCAALHAEMEMPLFVLVIGYAYDMGFIVIGYTYDMGLIHFVLWVYI